MAKSYATGITAEQLRALLHYDPETGLFRWREGINHWRAGLPAGSLQKPRKIGMRRIGIVIGTSSERRYAEIGVRKRLYKAHRLAWLYYYGEWPDGQIDHINGDGTDNRIANLRITDNFGNSANRGLRVDNKSGIKGVSWSKRSKKWLAHIGHRNHVYHLGLFDTIEEAKAVRDAAARRLHGEFHRTD